MIRQQKFTSTQIWSLEVGHKVSAGSVSSEASLLGLELGISRSSNGHPSVPLFSAPFFLRTPVILRVLRLHPNNLSLNFNFILMKHAMSNYSHILTYWGSQLKHRNLGYTIQPTTKVLGHNANSHPGCCRSYFIYNYPRHSKFGMQWNLFTSSCWQTPILLSNNPFEWIQHIRLKVTKQKKAFINA